MELSSLSYQHLWLLATPRDAVVGLLLFNGLLTGCATLSILPVLLNALLYRLLERLFLLRLLLLQFQVLLLLTFLL